MFLHIGADIEVMKRNIIAIIDIESVNDSKISQDFLQNIQRQGNLYNVSEDIPKSIVLLDNDNKSEIYLSPISSTTLQKRIDFVQKLM